jgi:hypothetical protein
MFHRRPPLIIVSAWVYCFDGRHTNIGWELLQQVLAM